MKKTKKKLDLSTQTIAVLDDKDLRRVAGAGPRITDNCFTTPTINCTIR